MILIYHEDFVTMPLMINSNLITIAYGDGIGHEVMDAALAIMREAGAKLEIETIQIGQPIYKMGSSDGVLPSSWESLGRTRILLKGPVVRPEDKENNTTAICNHFAIDIASRTTRECSAQPDISAVSYIGEGFALFEPLQDAMPELTGKNKAHPGAMILAATMMLEHIGQYDAANRILIALETALKNQKKKLKTTKFTESMIEHLFVIPQKAAASAD
jgi:isocitrate/isopropylmalate dehydrogenase